MKRIFLLLIVLLLTPLGAFAQTYSTSGGKLLKNGTVIQLRGFAVLDDALSSLTATGLLQMFPGLNFVSISNQQCTPNPGYGCAQPNSVYQTFVNDMTSHGIIVMISDYTPGQPNVRTGGDLTASLAWYASLATLFKNNPNVFWTTENEVNDAGGTSMADQYNGIYNSVRCGSNSLTVAGGCTVINNGIIFMEVPNNAYSGTSVSFGNVPISTFNGMTNIGVNIHQYPVTYTNQGYSTQAQYDQQSANTVAGMKSLINVPVMCGECGNSTTGDPVNPDDVIINGVWATTQSWINNTGTSANNWSASVAWIWSYEGLTGEGDELVALNFYPNGTATLSPIYGHQLANGIALCQNNGCGTGGGGGGGGGEAITINTIGNQQATIAFPVSGSISGAPSGASTPVGEGTVACQTAAFMNNWAATVTNTVNTQIPGGECFDHPCVPITMIPGDILPDDGNFYIDKSGNRWSLSSEPGQIPPGWWGDRVVNGATVPGGPPDYLASLRLIGGVVYMQFAKFGGWYLGHQLSQTNAVQFFLPGGDPGPGDFCRAASGPGIPTLQYQDTINGVAGSWLSLPAGSLVTTTTYSFTHPAVATPAASFAVAVRDANNTAVFATSNAFVMNAISGSDARLMCSDVGAAVNTANPGLLIICEGPITNSATLFSGAANQTAFVGDLSAVATLPVTGIAAGKLLYSVHDYPTNVSRQTPDATSPTTATRNVAWGYLETQNTAPVWIGAMGASLDGTNGSLTDDQGWSALLVSYLNGGQNAAGGPVFTGVVLPMSTNWWSWGNRASENPNGTLNADGSLKAGQQAIWSQLLFKVPIVPPVVTTWDPANNSNMVLSGNNLIASAAAGGISAVRSTTSKSAGKICWQEVLTTVTANLSVGFADPSWVLTNPIGSAFSFDTVPGSTQALYSNNVLLSVGTASTVTNGEAVTMCADFGAKLYWFTDATMRLTNPWNNDILANQNPATGAGGIPFSAIAGPWFIQANDDNESSVTTLNPTGPFAVTTPAGFSPWDAVASPLGTRPSLLINLGANDNLPPTSNDNVKVRLVSTMELGQ